jgi:DNA-binding NarL/FixJ family response regulator
MNILIADKSFKVREQLKEVISDIYQDSQLQETESNKEAISILFNYRPNLIITDIDLNDGIGLGLLSFATSLTPTALIIVFTNDFSYDLKSITLKMGADYCLPKSNGITTIKEILNQQENKMRSINRIIYS